MACRETVLGALGITKAAFPAGFSLFPVQAGSPKGLAHPSSLHREPTSPPAAPGSPGLSPPPAFPTFQKSGKPQNHTQLFVISCSPFLHFKDHPRCSNIVDFPVHAVRNYSTASNPGCNHKPRNSLTELITNQPTLPASAFLLPPWTGNKQISSICAVLVPSPLLKLRHRQQGPGTGESCSSSTPSSVGSTGASRELLPSSLGPRPQIQP